MESRISTMDFYTGVYPIALSNVRSCSNVLLTELWSQVTHTYLALPIPVYTITQPVIFGISANAEQ